MGLGMWEKERVSEEGEAKMNFREKESLET